MDEPRSAHPVRSGVRRAPTRAQGHPFAHPHALVGPDALEATMLSSLAPGVTLRLRAEGGTGMLPQYDHPAERVEVQSTR